MIPVKKIKSSHWWKIYFPKKNPLQDLLSSLNAIISTNERNEFITDHMTYSRAYTYINLIDDNHPYAQKD